MGLFSRLLRSRQRPSSPGAEARRYLSIYSQTHLFETSKFLDCLLADALHWRATDIHVIPSEDNAQVRFRVDGGLRDFLSLEPRNGRALVQRIKVLAGMDYLNSWEPQDGAGVQELNGEQVAFRASTMPVKMASATAERAVLRLYWKRDFDLERLDLDSATLAAWRQLLREPQGMLVLTGPANSGKTTTLYASLLDIQSYSRGERNLATVEDPVEFPVPGLSQSQINDADNFGFAQALRALMRQDPQVIMIGEIRDSQTAEMAINASLTGHLILTTVHSKQVTGVFPRLEALGIDPVRTASAVLGVLNQRLLRLNCPECASEYAPVAACCSHFSPEALQAAQFRRGRGCAQCAQTGYQGRALVSELLVLNRELRAAVCSRVTSQALYDSAIQTGMTTIWQSAMHRAWNGQTPLEAAVETVGTESEGD